MTPYRQFLVDSLRRGAAEVEGLVLHFPAESADTELVPGEWAARTHISHLRDIERRYVERLEGVLADGEYVPVAVQHIGPRNDETVAEMLEGYREARERAIEIYEGLGAERWAHVFNHPTIWGDVTVEWWAERFIQHTAEHIEGLWMLRQYAALDGRPRERYRRLLAN
jgi:DinB superfamily